MQRSTHILIVFLLWVLCVFIREIHSQSLVHIAGANLGDGDLALNVPLNFPTGAEYYNGELYIAVTSNHVIRKILANGTITTVVGTGDAGYSGNGGLAINAMIQNPSYLTFSSNGDMYFAGSKYRIHKVSNGIITTIAGTGSNGNTGDGGPALSATLGATVGGIAVASNGDVYFSDTDNHVVRKISGGNIYRVAGTGNVGYVGNGGNPLSADLNTPKGVALSSSGDLYIADTNNCQIRKISGSTISLFAGGATCGSSGDGGSPSQALLRSPISIKFSASGDLYILDKNNYRVRKVSNGIITTVAGGGSANNGDGGEATKATFSDPIDVAVSGDGSIAIVESQKYTVRMVKNGNISTIAGNGYQLFYGEGTIAKQSNFISLGTVVIDNQSNIYLVDSYTIRKISNGIISKFAGGGNGGSGSSALTSNIGSPDGFAIASNGDFYLADTSDSIIRKISNGTMTHYSGTLGSLGIDGDGNLATSAGVKFRGPNGLAMASNGDLFIADTSNHRIRKISGSSGIISTLAGSSTGGNGGYSGDGVLATNAILKYPQNVAVSSKTGDVYISDSYNYLIRKVTVSTGIISTIAGTKKSGFGIDGLIATSVALGFVKDIIITENEEVLFADSENNVIRKISTDGKIYTLTHTMTTSPLFKPSGLAVSPSGDLYLTDNTRLFLYVPPPSCNGTAFSDKTVCSGHGDCVSKDVCKCTTHFGGTFCQYKTCFDLLETDTKVCNGKGTCSSNGICDCNNGWSGGNCSLTTCYGILASASNVCGHQGSCVDLDVCNCNDGYTGENCTIPKCFGIIYNSSNVCSGHGECISGNICDCSEEWFGSKCEITTCFGRSSNDTLNVCSGNGQCISNNTCQCNVGWYGSNCETTTCFGIPSNETSVCSAHGQCFNFDECRCNVDYTNDNCSIPICFGKLSNDSFSCSSNGKCISNNTCQCNAHWFGSECSIPECFGKLSNDSNVCSQHGQCNGVDNCNCVEGYTGLDCSIPICFDKLANDTLNVCSGNGQCISNNTCQCNENWFESMCQLPRCFGKLANESVNVCSSHGQCVANNTCQCNAHWFGSECSIPECFGKLSNESNACSNHGKCIDVDNCKCFEGYTGLDCSIPICFGRLSNDTLNVCSSHGQCISNNTCQCNYGWTEKECNMLKCFDIRSDNHSVCGGHGECVAVDTCKCFEGWNSSNCTIPYCFGVLQNEERVCSFNGQCISNNTCQCNDNWFGKECELTHCFDEISNSRNVCSIHGKCSSFNRCECQFGWEGSSCSEPICFSISKNDTRVCSSHGQCVSNNTCECNYGWYGSECSLISCFGHVLSDNSSMKDICSGNGNCENVDFCKCNYGWKGFDCSIHTCFGFEFNNSMTCSGNGVCSSVDTCVCSGPEWSGNNCSIHSCNLIPSTDTTTCFGHGHCSSMNQCVCDSENFSGEWCEMFNCYGKWINTSSTICKLCIPSMNCSNHGDCDINGNCQCHSNSSFGYWKNSTCSVCQENYYGQECLTRFQDPVTILDDFSGITFKIYGRKQDNQQIDCSKIIPTSEMYLYGKNPICNWNSSTLMFSIIFGIDYQLTISQNINLNMLVFDSITSPTQLISTTVLFPSNPSKPQAMIAPTRETFGSCEEITLDASQSSSFDKKQLTYIWTIPKTNIFNFESNSSLIILPSNSPSGDYIIILRVKSLYSALESETVSISFTKNTISLPVVSISGSSNGYISAVVSQTPLVIGTLVTLPDCISNYSSSLQYKWEKISGPNLNMISDTKDLIITQFLQKTIEFYSFKVTVTVNNLGLTASSFVYLNTTLEPFTMILFNSELTTEKAIIESELSTNVDLSQEIVKWSCTSAFSNDPCDSNINNILNQYSNSKTITLLSIPSSVNPILLYLQVRDVKSSISITFPTSVNNIAPLINLLSVSPSDKTVLASKDILNLQLSISINGIEDGIESKLNRSWTLNGNSIPSSYLDQSNMPTTLSSSNFILLSISQLQPSSSNVLQLVATNLESGLSSSYSFKFSVAAPIPICTITSSTNQAYALETKVTFSLSNCILNSNLQSKYYYQDKSGSILLLASGNTITSLLPYQDNGVIKINMFLTDKTTGESSTSSISLNILLPIAKSTKEIKTKQKAWELQYSKLLPGDPQLNVLNAGTISQVVQALINNMANRKRSITCQNGVLDSVTQLCICNNGFAKLDCSISTDEWLERNELMDSLATMFYNSFKNRNKYEKLTGTYLISQMYSMRNILKVYDELSNQSIDNLFECLSELCILSINTNGIEIPSGFDNLFIEVVNNIYRFRIGVLKESFNSITISQLQNVTSEMTNVMVNSKFIGGIPLNIKYDFTKITTNRIYPRDLSEYILEQSGSTIKLPTGMMKYVELASYSKRKPITIRIIKSDYSNIKLTPQINPNGKQLISDMLEFQVLEISLSNITERIHFGLQSYVNSSLSSTNSLDCGIKINGEWDRTYCTLRNISDSFYDCSCTRQGMVSIFLNIQQGQILNSDSSIPINSYGPKMEFLSLLILIPVLTCIIIVIVGVVIKVKKEKHQDRASTSTAFEMQNV